MELNNIEALLAELGEPNLDKDTVYRYRNLIRIVVAILKSENLIE